MNCLHPEERMETFFPARDYISGERFEIRRCNACGLTLTWPLPRPERLGDYYPAEYYGVADRRRFLTLAEVGQNLLCGWRARQIERWLGPGTERRLLDVGCGRGWLLSVFRRRGWSVEGVEISERAAQYARETLGLPVYVGPLQTLQLPSARFDAVVMWQVLEHISDPNALLAEVHRILRPGGVFMVSVPNFGSPEARVCRAGWFHLDVPRHLVHFTPDTLRSCLREQGFNELHCSWFAPEYDLFNFVQSTQNRLGLRQNLLYELLRTRSAKLLRDAGGRWWQAVLALLLAAPLGLLGLVTTALAGLLRRGSILTRYVRKPAA